MHAELDKKIFLVLLAGAALWLTPVPASASEGRLAPSNSRLRTSDEHVGQRPKSGRGHHPSAHRFPNYPGIWWAPSEPPPVETGPSVVIIQPSPVSVPAEPPPAPPEPSYYWYYCGSQENGTSSREQQHSYCIGGLSPSVRGAPGPGKTLEQFQADDAACLHLASASAATLPGSTATERAPGSVEAGASSSASGTMQGRYDLAYQQCLYAKGNQFPGMPGAVRSGSLIPPPPSRR